MKKRIAEGFSIYYIRFIIRLALCVWTIAEFVKSKFTADIITSNQKFFYFMWALFFIELILKLFPSKFENMGSQKQFRENYVPAIEKVERIGKVTVPYALRTLFVAIVWITANGIFTVLYAFNVFNTGIMIILFLLYAVGDMVCVLFYCPFQEIIGNRCCSTCRIHNWDSPMMCTPLIFIKNPFTFSLVILSWIILARWEWSVHKHPERFSEKTNLNLTCKNCPETYCTRRGKVFRKHDILGEIKNLLKR